MVKSASIHKVVTSYVNQTQVSIDTPFGKKIVNNSYEIPYLAGYSKDGKTIYIDKRLNPIFELKDGRKMDITKYTVIHECAEKILEDAIDYKYPYAHQQATGEERKAVEDDGYPWDEYQRYALSEVRRLKKLDPSERLPIDLDEKPEKDTKDYPLLKKIHKQKELSLKTAAPSSDSQNLMNIEKMLSKRMQGHFGYGLPQDVILRTYKHPEYQADKSQNTHEDDGGFITKDFKKIYVDLDRLHGKDLEDFIAHEMGHFLDKHLGGNQYFSRILETGLSPRDASENFAKMVSFVLTEGNSGGPIQSSLYSSVCDELGIKNRVKPGVKKASARVVDAYLKLSDSKGIRLWIDDLRDPKQYKEPSAVWVKNYVDAIKQIDTGSVVWVSFDHDLGEDKSGYDIAKYIEEGVFNGIIPYPEWKVHSANPSGGANIERAMKSAERFSKK